MYIRSGGEISLNSPCLSVSLVVKKSLVQQTFIESSRVPWGNRLTTGPGPPGISTCLRNKTNQAKHEHHKSDHPDYRPFHDFVSTHAPCVTPYIVCQWKDSLCKRGKILKRLPTRLTFAKEGRTRDWRLRVKQNPTYRCVVVTLTSVRDTNDSCHLPKSWWHRMYK